MPPPKPYRTRLFYIFNGWRQAILDSKPRLARNFYSPALQKALNELLNSQAFDILQAQQFLTAQYLPKNVGPPSVLDVGNLWSKLVVRENALVHQSRPTRRIQTRLDERKIKSYERKNLQRFTAALAISPEEESEIKCLSPDTLTAVVPNGVDAEFFRPGESNLEVPGRVAFTGTMAWEPNADAAQYYARDILPLVQRTYPQTSFQIVGRDPTQELRGLAKDPAVQVAGFVPDIRPYLADCQVFAAPIRAGAGTRLKILEALAMEKPVVAITLAAEGLGLIHGKEILIANDPITFARHVTRLLEDKELRRTLGMNGRKRVRQSYDWAAISAELDNLYQELARLSTSHLPGESVGTPVQDRKSSP